MLAGKQAWLQLGENPPWVLEHFCRYLTPAAPNALGEKEGDRVLEGRVFS